MMIDVKDTPASQAQRHY